MTRYYMYAIPPMTNYYNTTSSWIRHSRAELLSLPTGDAQLPMQSVIPLIANIILPMKISCWYNCRHIISHSILMCSFIHLVLSNAELLGTIVPKMKYLHTMNFWCKCYNFANIKAYFNNNAGVLHTDALMIMLCQINVNSAPCWVKKRIRRLYI